MAIKYILEVQSNANPAKVFKTIKQHGGESMPVPANHKGVTIAAIFKTGCDARRTAEALVPIATKIFPARVALNSKTDSEGPYYLDVRSDSQALDEGIIAVIHAHQGELLCLDNGRQRRVCGIFASRSQAIEAARQLNGTKAMVFSRAEARRIKAAKQGRATKGPSLN